MSKRRDDAEAWLRANDPEYAVRKKAWTTPSTDVLENIGGSAHDTLRDLHPIGELGNGSYKKKLKATE